MKSVTAVQAPGAINPIRTGDIPEHASINLAQACLEAIKADFQRPEVQEAYARWLREKRKVQT